MPDALGLAQDLVVDNKQDQIGTKDEVAHVPEEVDGSHPVFDLEVGVLLVDLELEDLSVLPEEEGCWENGHPDAGLDVLEVEWQMEVVVTHMMPVVFLLHRFVLFTSLEFRRD